MIVRVKLFAVARQRLGRDEVQIELPDASGGPTVKDLRAALARKFAPLADVLPHVRMAINSDYAADSSQIPPSAEVALIPPVSGG